LAVGGLLPPQYPLLRGREGIWMSEIEPAGLGLVGICSAAMPTRKQASTLALLNSATAPLGAREMHVRFEVLADMRKAGWVAGRKTWVIQPAGRDALARWRSATTLIQPDFKLATLQMDLPPFGDGQVITFDGSADHVANVGACAAATGSGRALVGWWLLPSVSAVPQSTYAELQGLRLALRLTAALGVTEVRSDCREVVREARAAKNGETISTRVVGDDSAAVAEVTERLLEQSVAVVWEGAARRGGNGHMTATTVAGAVVHRLAITTCRMIRDGFDPAAEQGFLRHMAVGLASPRKAAVDRAYSHWRAAKPHRRGI
jgi:hypothetical protein